MSRMASSLKLYVNPHSYNTVPSFHSLRLFLSERAGGMTCMITLWH